MRDTAAVVGGLVSPVNTRDWEVLGCASGVATTFAGILAYRFDAIRAGELPAVVATGLLFGCCSALKFQCDARRDWADRAPAEEQQDDRQLTRLVLGSFLAAIALFFMAARFGS